MKLRDITGLLPVTYRRQSRRIIAGILVQALLDLAGVAALLAVLLLLLADNSHHRYAGTAALGGTAIITAKNILAIRLERSRNRYLMSLYRHFSLRLLRCHYHRGLPFVRRKGAAALTYEVNYVCYTFVLQVLAPLMHIAGEALLLALITGALAVCFPLMTAVIAACFIPAAWGYMRFMRQRLCRYGEKENQAKHRQWELVQELFRGYAEVETCQAYDTFHNQFEYGLGEISLHRERTETYRRLPAALTETGMAAALLAIIVTAPTGATLSVTLGAFGTAAFRILPGVRSLAGAWMQLRNNRFAATILAQALKSDGTEAPAGAGTAPATEITFRHEISARHLSFAYSPGQNLISGFSFTVKRGECVGIQGISGAGKSTLFNLLLGFFEPASGEICIDGTPLTPANRRSWQRLVGYVPQEVFIRNGTVAENIALGEPPGQADPARIKSVLRQVRLDRWAGSLPCGTESLLGENGCRISGGQKQRIGIARALYKGAEVLLLDEATSSLDPSTEEEIIQLIRELAAPPNGLTLLMIAHHSESLRICNRIIQMKTNT